jgi:Na+-driven multidrug efflux pump
MQNEDWKRYVGKDDVSEGFCGACLAVPLAFAGLGSSAYGSSGTRKDHKKKKKIAFWAGIVSVILSIIIAIYYLTSCSTCR